MNYLLDTNICIYIIKKRPQSVIEHFLSLSFERLSISSITVAELQFGVKKSSNPSKNQIALNEFLAPFKIEDFNTAASTEYGTIRFELEKKGLIIGPLDMLIAAQAKSLNLILVTNNEREFSRVESLSIENWV